MKKHSMKKDMHEEGHDVERQKKKKYMSKDNMSKDNMMKSTLLVPADPGLQARPVVYWIAQLARRSMTAETITAVR